MCKTTRIAYTCGHTASFRLSRCGGTFTYRVRKQSGEQAWCTGAALFAMKSAGECGPCAREVAGRGWREELEMLRGENPTAWGDDGAPEVVVVAERVYAERMYVLDKRFPGPRSQGWEVDEEGSLTGRRRWTSLLRTEVRPEDVILEAAAWPGTCGADSWSWDGWDDADEGNWPRLEDEIAENQVGQEATGAMVSRVSDVADHPHRHWSALQREETKTWETSSEARPDFAKETRLPSMPVQSHGQTMATENTRPSLAVGPPKSKWRVASVLHTSSDGDRGESVLVNEYGYPFCRA